MFLGWVFNMISLAFIQEHIPGEKQRKYERLIVLIQVLLLGMVISFPLQGYGVYSITLSSLHTLMAGVFSVLFFRDTKSPGFDASRWLARLALFFFLLSSLGPFSLGPLMVNGMGQTKWYYFAVYYYLHFQYNGVFTFSVLSLFFGLLKDREVAINLKVVKRFIYLMTVSCILGYSLSLLWAKPGIIFYVLAFIAATLQFIAFFYFLKIIRSIPRTVINYYSFSTRVLFSVAVLSFVIKLVLQGLSVHPWIAQLSYEVRNYVIAYLHLVLVGMISCFLLGWSIEKKWVREPTRPILAMFLIGFVGMELVMINPVPLNDRLINFANLLFLFSTLLVFAIGYISFTAIRRE